MGLEPEAPPKEKVPWMAPAGAGGGLKGANRKFATGRQVPPLADYPNSSLISGSPGGKRYKSGSLKVRFNAYDCGL